MNIEQANTIPLSEILDKLGSKTQRVNGDEVCYLSPFRLEKTPSFFVNKKKNVWHDFGHGKGGDVVAFVCTYLEYSEADHTPADALRWLKNMIVHAPKASARLPDPKDDIAKLTIRSVNEIKLPGLILYLEKRGIPLSVAKNYLKQLRVHNANTGKYFSALGFKNESGGYELRNPGFKGSVKPKDITFIRGRLPGQPQINMFEAGWDFLSAITQRNGENFDCDTIITHSVSGVEKAKPYISNYHYKIARTWMDNDVAGHMATANIRDYCKSMGLIFSPQNKLYAPYKDVNEHHVLSYK